jgi:hypothetical protein
VAERTAEGIIGSGALQAGSPTERKIKRSLALIKYVCVLSITRVMSLNANKVDVSVCTHRPLPPDRVIDLGLFLGLLKEKMKRLFGLYMVRNPG